MRFCHSLEALQSAIGQDGQHSVLIYDRAVPIGSLAASVGHCIAVEGGEGLKTWSRTGALIEEIVRDCPFLGRGSGKLLALGGGSVTDAVGFIASILERGVRLELIPSTWLAALDSAHGGKNGLNGTGFKNQVGTFYEPAEVWLVRELLLSQPKRLADSAWAELIKMAWIDGGPWTEALIPGFARGSMVLWNLLPEAIAAKLKVVGTDPKEQSGERAVLNLGHSVGHALELEFGLDHGSAVGAGLGFAVRWSQALGLISPASGEALLSAVAPWEIAQTLSVERLRAALARDKKRRGTDLRETFLVDDDARPLGVKASLRWVGIDALLEEALRQGLCHV